MANGFKVGEEIKDGPHDKSINVKIPSELHHGLRKAAAERKTTLRALVILYLSAALRNDKKVK